MIKTEFGKTYINYDGYYQISSGRYCGKKLHRLIWEKFYNKSIPNGYVIHHINGDKTDNRIQNLQCVTNENHSRFHNIGKKSPMDGKRHTIKSRKKMSENSTYKIPIITKRGFERNKKQKYGIHFKHKPIYQSVNYDKICSYYRAIMFNLKYKFIQ